MRVALISDIHANLVALDTALADIRASKVDRIVCLGDIADLGPQPAQTLARLRELGCPCVAGNHDPFTDNFPGLMGVIEWCKNQLTDADRAYLRQLPPTLPIELAPGVTMLCIHGSPQSADFQFLGSTPDSALDEWQLEDWEQHSAVRVVVCGHTHVQLMRRYKGRTYVNVGSVGQPFLSHFDGTTPPRCLKRVEYAIVEWDNGRLSVDLRSLPLDWRAFEQALRSSGFPDPDAWLTNWEANSH